MVWGEREPAVTRRGFIGGAAGIATGIALTGTGTAAASASATPTVLTRNAYLGVGLGRLLDAESLEDVRRIAGELLADVDPALYEARADAIAGEIEAADADIVALQEAVLIRTQSPGDFGSNSADPAGTAVVDFLALIESALDARDLGYDVAAATLTTDVELPAETNDGQVDIRVTNRDVLLVREGTETRNTIGRTYDADLQLPIPGTDRQLSVTRGYCIADVRMSQRTFTAVSTHLESTTALVRRRQAKELLDRLPTDRPVVLCGDFNSGPGTATDTYDLLTENFEDAWAARQPGTDGFTCCQAASLRNGESRLDERVDGIFSRGSVETTAVQRIGHEPDDRIEIQQGGETVRVWPSDHAGVVAELEIAASAPTPTATSTGTSTTESTPTPRTDDATPGTDSTSTPTADDGTPEAITPGDTGPGLGILLALLGVGLGALTRLYSD